MCQSEVLSHGLVTLIFYSSDINNLIQYNTIHTTALKMEFMVILA